MNRKFNLIDLHTHSTASDGSYSPKDLVSLADKASLCVIALTDHDTMSGVEECFNAGVKLGINVIPGIEMSCVYKEKEIHILGYLLPDSISQKEIHISKEIISDLEFFSNERAKRNEEIIKRFADDNIIIDKRDLYAADPHAQITRAHFANVLIKMGIVNNKSEAFEKYLEYGGKYIPVKKITTKRCMEFLNRHNFFISLAHPLLYKFSDEELNELLIHLKDMGLHGIEVFHSTHSRENIQKLSFLAEKYDLLPTGGSDFHGSNKPGLFIGSGYGNLKIPYQLLENILNSRK